MSEQFSNLSNIELVEACATDPLFFAETFVRIGGDHPMALVLDSGKTEFIEAIDNEDIIVGRYPRRYGKTTLLHTYALHQALFEGKKVAIQSNVAIRQIQFLSDIAVMHRNLPVWMQAKLTESADCLSFNNGGKIISYGFERGEGMDPDVLLIDEPHIEKRTWSRWNPEQMIAQRTKKTVFIGTFEKGDSTMGKVWEQGLELGQKWTSLPTRKEEQNIRAVLELSNPAYSRGY